MEDTVMFRFVDPRGFDEPGVGSGVTRDVYSSFWNEVANCYLIGETERVPFVRHDLYTEEWDAIGKILVKGFLDTNYFPTVLSSCFIYYCLFEESDDEMVLSSFKRFVAPDECSLIEKLLSTDALDEDFTSEDCLEFLD